MNKPLKIALITLAAVVGIPFLLFCGYTFLFADFFSGPSKKECVKIAQEFLGYKLGKEYEILDYDAKSYHPDQPLSFSIKLPTEKFQKVIEFCESEAKKELGDTRDKDGEYDVITSPIHRTSYGYTKDKEVINGDYRVYFERIDVDIDEGLITFGGSGY